VEDFEPPFTRANKEHRTNTESNILSNCLKFISVQDLFSAPALANKLLPPRTPILDIPAHGFYVCKVKHRSFSYVWSKTHLCVRSAISSLFARSLPVCDCCIVIDMESLAAEYGAKLKECEEILATMPVSAVKSKADAVQHLLNDNTNLMSGVFESPMCAAHYFFNSTIMVPL
jgi:hypothetical protein